MFNRNERVPEHLLLAFSLLVLIILSMIMGLAFVDSFIIAYLVYTLFRFLNNLGYTINILDFLTFYSALDTLLSPLINYRYFGIENPIARLWGTYMRIPEDIYFSYLIPANIALFLGLHHVFNKNAKLALAYVERAKVFAADKFKAGVIFIVIGMVASQLKNLIPGSIAYIFYLLAMLPYVGGLYIYFSVKKRKGLVMAILIIIFFSQAALSGLFGECIMFIVLAGCMIAPQYKISFFRKLATFLLCFSLVVLIQSYKREYRNITWTNARDTKNKYSEYVGKGNLEIFFGLAIDRISNPSQIFSKASLFALNQRFNQGRLIAMAMHYVPRVEPFANGETIGLSLAAVAVPRILWPDKPESGGAYNLSRFLGIKKRLNYSMNIGPYGEAYGNFGIAGAVVFIFLYATLVAYFLSAFLGKAKKYPSLIIWMPLVFYDVLTVETDILSTINSFIKIIVFVAFVYWVCKKAFRTEI